VAAHAAAGDRVLATAPRPLALLILFSAVGGTVLALIGFWLRRLGPTG
jgi:hypothetical protein